MNYVAALSTSLCSGCDAEVTDDELSRDHVGMCCSCGKDLQATLDAEAAEELLSDDEIVAALLETEPDAVLEAAERAKQLVGGRFSERRSA